MRLWTACASLVCGGLLCAATPTADATPPTADATPAAPRGYQLELALKAGNCFAEHRFANDRIEWKLPRKRLQPFIRAGAVIHEERHVAISVHACVTYASNTAASLTGSADVLDVDVPRHRQHRERQAFAGTLTAKNEAPGVQRPDIEDAAMMGLPERSLRSGDCWLTQRKVATQLGSGRARIRHCLESRDGNLLQVTVHGDGDITGQEYHLPKLLPGTIQLDGAAWFDLDQKLVTQESYRIHNRLLKPAENEQIGFDEILQVDITTRRR